MDNLFTGEDSENSAQLVKEQARILERRVVILRYLSFTGTAQDKGTAPTRGVTPIESSVQMRVMTGKDILNNGGIYSLGDLEISTRTPMYSADNVNVTQADKMLMDGVTYTMQGRVFPVPMAAGTTFFKAVFRRSS